MDSRLESLVKLYTESLERDLGQAAQAELDALLEDPRLVEEFGQWQAAMSPAEGAEPGQTPELDKRVRGSFNGRGWASRHWPQLLVGAIALAGLGVFIHALMPRKPDVMMVSGDDAPMAVRGEAPEEPRHNLYAEAKPRPTLGLPPGFGERPTKLEARIDGNVELRWTMAHAGRAEVRVLDDHGNLVRKVWSGHADSGRYTNRWNGKDQAGTVVAPGPYTLQALRDGKIVAEQRVDLSSAE
jgi:hypothetical protein